jgi:hypothetical protein
MKKNRPGRSLLERIGFNADQRAQLAAMIPPLTSVLAHVSNERHEIAITRAKTELANAEALRNLSALALVGHKPEAS